MPGATPNRNYPFPLGGDPIDIAGDAERLALAIDSDILALVNSGTASSAALQAEINARTAADTALGNRITAEHNAWVQRDNELIADYIARDNNLYNGYRADDGYYAVTAWSHGAYRNDRIVVQGSYGEYVCDGYSTFVVGLPVAYPNRYYTPICATANTQPWLITPMDPGYREAGQFRCHARRATDGASLAGTAVAVWWTTIGVTI
jgi:hypothetical protein